MYLKSTKLCNTWQLHCTTTMYSFPDQTPLQHSMTEQQLDCALDLMRRLPPQQIEKNLSDLIDLVPDLCEDLLSSVDQPLKIARDKQVGKDYLLCDYNRDGDSYRLVTVCLP